MSLLNEDIIKIKLYYKYEKKKNGNRLVVLSDERAEELMKDEKKKEEIEVLNTEWRSLSWEDHNKVLDAATMVADPVTGARGFNTVKYRDAMVKNCLKAWDLKENSSSVPVTQQNINRLPAQIVVSLYDKFDVILNYTEQEVGN